jgi:hypothetical protein
MADKNEYQGEPSPAPEEPKPLDLTDPKYFPPMPTEPAKPHAENVDALEKAGYDLEAQSFVGEQPVAKADKKAAAKKEAAK